MLSPVWSGIRIPKAETKGRSRRCSYATPHEVITSYRCPDKECFAFISHCFMSDCKISTLWQCLRWPLSSPYILSVRAVTIVTSHYSTHCSTNNSVWGDGKGWDSWKGALIKFIINTLHSLVYWPTIGLYFIKYKKKNTFIWCAVCGEIVLYTGDPQQIITYLWIY